LPRKQANAANFVTLPYLAWRPLQSRICSTPADDRKRRRTPGLRWQPPLLTKVPLARWLPGRRHVAADHLMAPPGNPGDVTGALLHFKFLQDFTDRVAARPRGKLLLRIGRVPTLRGAALSGSLIR
jgi:hypothetical protein